MIWVINVKDKKESEFIFKWKHEVNFACLCSRFSLIYLTNCRWQINVKKQLNSNEMLLWEMKNMKNFHPFIIRIWMSFSSLYRNTSIIKWKKVHLLLDISWYRNRKEKYLCCLTHTCDNLNLPHTWDCLENSASFMGCWENSALLDPPHPTWSMTGFLEISIGDRQRKVARAIRESGKGTERKLTVEDCDTW